MKKHPHSLVVSSTLNDGTKHGPVTIPMRKKDLLEAARTGEFFSYVAGVAYKMLTDYQISGIVIDNYKTTLPAKKGLSSSAAVRTQALARLVVAGWLLVGLFVVWWW